MLSSEKVPAPPEVAARLAATAGEFGRGSIRSIGGGLSRLAIFLAALFGAFAIADLLWAGVHRGAWIALTLGVTLLVGPFAVLFIGAELRGRPARLAAAAALRTEAATGQVVRHTLHRNAEHWFVEHEHGVILVCPADAPRTLYVTLSSVTDDERWEWYAKGCAHRAIWIWYSAADGAFQAGFSASGDPLPPNSLEAAAGSYDPDIAGELFGFLGSPEDGAVIDRPFAEVDAFLRSRIAAPATGG
jgi:hypothetical protein